MSDTDVVWCSAELLQWGGVGWGWAAVSQWMALSLMFKDCGKFSIEIVKEGCSGP